MRYRIALATCNEYPQLCPDDKLLLAPLAEHGIEAVPMLWQDRSINWRLFAAVVIRSTWDYYVHIEAFRAWLDRLEAAGVRVFNPVAVVRANLDKSYLKDLAARGVKTVETLWTNAADVRTLAATLATVKWPELVLKPSISAGSYRTLRLKPEELLADPTPLAAIVASSTAMIQPFLPEIARDGEWSFLFFGQDFSHAILKRAQPGDFRVQWRHGGTHRRQEPPAGILRQVHAVFDLLAGERLYTRIDGIIRDGQFIVVEVEMIEPFLFLGEDGTAPARFAAAVYQLLERPSPPV